MDKAGDYSIGSAKLPGLAKMAEEAGELVQAIAKLIATNGDPKYYDGTNLVDCLLEEMSDTLAALHFFVGANSIDDDKLVARAAEKLSRFVKWHHDQLLTGIPSVQK